jgi:hypothetical protein
MADGVQIRTELVTEFARTIRTDDFRSAAARGADLHHHGVIFGAAIAGETILEAKTRYAEMLANTEANLREYRRAAEAFATAAQQIAQSFATADEQAHFEIDRPLHEGQQ